MIFVTQKNLLTFDIVRRMAGARLTDVVDISVRKKLLTFLPEL